MSPRAETQYTDIYRKCLEGETIMSLIKKAVEEVLKKHGLKIIKNLQNHPNLRVDHKSRFVKRKSKVGKIVEKREND